MYYWLNSRKPSHSPCLSHCHNSPSRYTPRHSYSHPMQCHTPYLLTHDWPDRHHSGTYRGWCRRCSFDYHMPCHWAYSSHSRSYPSRCRLQRFCNHLRRFRTPFPPPHYWADILRSGTYLGWCRRCSFDYRTPCRSPYSFRFRTRRRRCTPLHSYTRSMRFHTPYLLPHNSEYNLNRLGCSSEYTYARSGSYTGCLHKSRSRCIGRSWCYCSRRYTTCHSWHSWVRNHCHFSYMK